MFSEIKSLDCLFKFGGGREKKDIKDKEKIEMDLRIKRRTEV